MHKPNYFNLVLPVGLICITEYFNNVKAAGVPGVVQILCRHTKQQPGSALNGVCALRQTRQTKGRINASARGEEVVLEGYICRYGNAALGTELGTLVPIDGYQAVFTGDLSPCVGRPRYRRAFIQRQCMASLLLHGVNPQARAGG